MYSPCHCHRGVHWTTSTATTGACECVCVCVCLCALLAGREVALQQQNAGYLCLIVSLSILARSIAASAFALDTFCWLVLQAYVTVVSVGICGIQQHDAVHTCLPACAFAICVYVGLLLPPVTVLGVCPVLAGVHTFRRSLYLGKSGVNKRPCGLRCECTFVLDLSRMDVQ